MEIQDTGGDSGHWWRFRTLVEIQDTGGDSGHVEIQDDFLPFDRV